MLRFANNSSFTLVELLVVLAIIAVLATVIVLVINPAELLKQFRDASRINDLASINRALNYVLVDCPTCFFGSSSIVYVSIPDSSPTCANLGLPSLPSGWSYACSDFNNYRKVNGAGWIPVDFTKFSAGSPLSKLPVDPINTTSTGNYYTYVKGSWKLTSRFESEKYIQNSARDNGVDYVLYEVGSNLSLAPFVGGLVGYYGFNEGSGDTIYDLSGYENHSRGMRNISYEQESNCIKGSCIFVSSDYRRHGYLDGFVYFNNRVFDFSNSSFSISFWLRVFLEDMNDIGFILDKGGFDASNGYSVFIENRRRLTFNIRKDGENFNLEFDGIDELFADPTIWHHIVYVYKNGLLRLYIDGELAAENGTVENLDFSERDFFIGQHYRTDWSFIGAMDELRGYNRALSPAEIKAIYDATK